MFVHKNRNVQEIRIEWIDVMDVHSVGINNVPSVLNINYFLASPVRNSVLEAKSRGKASVIFGRAMRNNTLEIVPISEI